MTFKYFAREEFDCQETGENEMEDEFIHALDALRHQCGIPFRITSGYRSPRHSIEAKKPRDILLKLKNLAVQDSTQEALQLILLLLMGLSVLLLLGTLLSSDSAALVLRQDLSM
jgi:hypothetical protein